MGNKLEQLLNSLIEKGWKPRGIEKVYNFGIVNGYTVLDTKKANYINFATSCVFREDYGEEQEMDYVSYTYRELVSKESGLWQFCIENKLVETDDDYSREKYRYNHGMLTEYKSRLIKGEARKYQVDYEFRLIESALKDESELEDFLLQNIVIKDE